MEVERDFWKEMKILEIKMTFGRKGSDFLIGQFGRSIKLKKGVH